jgi:hypothetical protein
LLSMTHWKVGVKCLCKTFQWREIRSQTVETWCYCGLWFICRLERHFRTSWWRLYEPSDGE